MSENQSDISGESANIDREAYNEAAGKYSKEIIEAIETNDRRALVRTVKKYARKIDSMLSSITGVKWGPSVDGVIDIEDRSPEEEEGGEFYTVGNMCDRREKYELAVAMYEEALRTFKHPSVLNNMASSFKRLGEYGKALECCVQALKLDPNYIVGYARAAILIEAYAVFSPTPAIEYINNYLSKGDF